MFRISFTYCPFAGALTVLLIGVPMSYMTEKSRTDSMDPDVFCPMTQYFLAKTRRRRSVPALEMRPQNSEQQDVYVALDDALKHLKEVLDQKE